MKEEFNIEIKKDLKYFAGHSLGEYSALVASGSLNFSDALILLHERGKSMQEAVPEGKGSMLAVMGLKLPELNKYISEVKKEKGVCEVANDNSYSQIILSGDKSAIDEISTILKNNKKKSIFLPVSAPFHCSLMAPAEERLALDLNAASFVNPIVPLINNVAAEVVQTATAIRDGLRRQVCNPVRWEESIRHLILLGVDHFVEVGPGRVLTGLMRSIDRLQNTSNVEDVKSLEKLTL